MQKFKRDSFVKDILSSDTSCFRYTGIRTIKLLDYIFEWIGPSARRNIKLWTGQRRTVPGRSKGRHRKVLSLYQEYIMTLVFLRKGFDNTHLAELFQVHATYVSKLCTSWILFFEETLGQLVRWPDSSDLTKQNLPSSFRRYPRTKAIIDCSELFCEKPFRPIAQRTTWSNYKHHNTFKFLISIMPSGAITFISKLYGGSISDESIVKCSGFLENIQNGDDIMADRGFNIRHLLLPKGATLNIPAFSHGKSLSAGALLHSRKVASVRIHVERAIRRMKTYKVLQGLITLKRRFLMSKILKIVAALCNLQQSLVK